MKIKDKGEQEKLTIEVIKNIEVTKIRVNRIYVQICRMERENSISTNPETMLNQKNNGLAIEGV